jgi:hypothetical protein
LPLDVECGAAGQQPGARHGIAQRSARGGGNLELDVAGPGHFLRGDEDLQKLMSIAVNCPASTLTARMPVRASRSCPRMMSASRSPNAPLSLTF